MHDEIHRQSEAMQDDLDHRYLTTGMTEEEYATKCAAIAAWELAAEIKAEMRIFRCQ